MFTVQSLIAVGVVIGVGMIWTMALVVAGAIWRRQEIREFMASHQATIPSQDLAEADDARELVLH